MKKFLFVFLGLISINAFNAPLKKWLFIYYMPYDNNLSKEGELILNEIKASELGSDIAISFQCDFQDTSGMTRYFFTSDTVISEKINEEKSSDPKVFKSYLKWAESKSEFENCVLIFLNHGGALNEIGLDEYPVHNYQKTEDLKQIILAFNKRNDILPELIFFQVCAKGVLEPLYEMRNCSRYTLCSQNILGAPNYYYKDLFNALNSANDFTGEELAATIAISDRKDMFYSYTCTDNMKFEPAIVCLNEFISYQLRTCNPAIHTDSILQIRYYGETHWDLKSFINAYSCETDSSIYYRNKLIKSLEELIRFHYINPNSALMKEYCGMSVYAVQNKNSEFPFQKMEIYKDLNLDYFHDKIQTTGEYIQNDTLEFR